MMQNAHSRVLSIFGTLLILCGLIGYLEIGIKARNLMFSGLITGAAAWIFSWLHGSGRITVWFGLILSFGCCLVYGQRAIANLLALIGIIQHEMPLDAYNKCIALVMLLFMSMASVTCLMLLYAALPAKELKSPIGEN